MCPDTRNFISGRILLYTATDSSDRDATKALLFVGVDVASKVRLSTAQRYT